MIPVYILATPEDERAYDAWRKECIQRHLPEIYVRRPHDVLGTPTWDVKIDYCHVFSRLVDEYYGGSGSDAWLHTDAAYYALLGKIMAFLTEHVATDPFPDFNIKYYDAPIFEMEITAYEHAQIQEIATKVEQSLAAYCQLVKAALPSLSASVTDLKTNHEIRIQGSEAA